MCQLDLDGPRSVGFVEHARAGKNRGKRSAHVDNEDSNKGVGSDGRFVAMLANAMVEVAVCREKGLQPQSNLSIMWP